MRIRRFSPVLLLAFIPLLWGMVVPIYAAPRAQPGTLIVYGQTVSGTITQDVPCVYYYFAGAAGDPVTIDMMTTSGTLDGVLRLFQGDGGFQPDGAFTQAPLAENDDRGVGMFDPLLQMTLPATGPYTIAACRLQAEFVTITTGTFDLTLTGPDALAGPTATPAGLLTAGIFGQPGATPSPGGDPQPVLGDGVTVNGALRADVTWLRYALPVRDGDQVTLTLVQANGNVAPVLRVTTPDGMAIAATGTPEPVTMLVLHFSAPTPVTLNVDVGRFGETLDGTAGEFTLSVAIMAGPAVVGDGAVAVPTQTPAPTAIPDAALDADYLANPCAAGAQAVTGITNTAILIDVYTASGDSYYADQLERTAIFRNDDDLNVVFHVQNVDQPVITAALFCAPDGTYQDAGERTMEVGGPYLLGIDWEYEAVPWIPGEWFVEVYVDGVIEVVLAFTVQ